MRQISLKWQLFLFYILLGFIPMVAISYFAVISYSRSINTLTDDYLTELVRQISEQTDALADNYFKYMNILSKYPFVQLSFQQYPFAGQIGTIQEKLELYRVNTESFDRIALFANDRHLVATTPSGWAENTDPPTEDLDHLIAGPYDEYHAVDISGPYPKLRLYKRVYDFQDPVRKVGVVAADVNLEKLLGLTRQLHIGDGVDKTVTARISDYRELAEGKKYGYDYYRRRSEKRGK